MGFFNANLSSGGIIGTVGGLVTRLDKTVLIGAGSNNKIEVNISNDIANYDTLDNDSFFVELHEIVGNVNAPTSAELSHSYDSVSGILTIESSSYNMPFRWTEDVTVDLTIIIAGAVQFPEPVLPEVPEYTINIIDKYYYINTKDITIKKNQVLILSEGILMTNENSETYMSAPTFNPSNSVTTINSGSTLPAAYPNALSRTTMYKLKDGYDEAIISIRNTVSGIDISGLLLSIEEI